MGPSAELPGAMTSESSAAGQRDLNRMQAASDHDETAQNSPCALGSSSSSSAVLAEQLQCEDPSIASGVMIAAAGEGE